MFDYLEWKTERDRNNEIPLFLSLLSLKQRSECGNCIMLHDTAPFNYVMVMGC